MKALRTLVAGITLLIVLPFVVVVFIWTLTLAAVRAVVEEWQ